MGADLKAKSQYVFFCLILIAWIPLGQAALIVKSLNVDVRIHKDARVSIREVYFFEGKSLKSIFPFEREWPLTFKTSNRDTLQIDYQMLSASIDNTRLSYEMKPTSDDHVIVAIKPPLTHQNQNGKRLVLEYYASNAIQFLDNQDVLEWQALANLSNRTIERVKVRVYAPRHSKFLSENIIFKNANGQEKERNFRKISKNVAYVLFHRPMYPEDKIEFSVSWPKGVVSEPPRKNALLKLIIRSPINLLYLLLGLIYISAFCYLFLCQDFLNGYQRFKVISPATIYALEHGKFDYRFVYYLLTSIAAKGGLNLTCRDNNVSINLLQNNGLTKLEKVFFEYLDTISLTGNFKVELIELNKKLNDTLYRAAIKELQMPKTKQQDYFFHIIFSINLIILFYVFGRYDPIFCLGIIYLLLGFPWMLRHYVKDKIYFDPAEDVSFKITFSQILYISNMALAVILIYASLYEFDYFLYRAPKQDLRVFQMIGLLNYLSVFAYIRKAFYYFRTLNEDIENLKDYFDQPTRANIIGSQITRDALQFYNHLITYAILFKGEKRFSEFCTNYYVKMDRQPYVVKWLVYEGNYEIAFHDVPQILELSLKQKLKANIL